MRKIENIKSGDVIALLKQQNYLCPLTGRKLTPETASLDHIAPLSRDGDHTIKNIWIVDCQANAAKGTLLAEEFVQLCREVTEYQRARESQAAGQRQMVPSPDLAS